MRGAKGEDTGTKIPNALLTKEKATENMVGLWVELVLRGPLVVLVRATGTLRRTSCAASCV